MKFKIMSLNIRQPSLQMNVSNSLEVAAFNQTIRISALDIDRKYEVVRAERITSTKYTRLLEMNESTRYGLSVMISIKHHLMYLVFMPRRYSTFSEEVIQEINSVCLFLVFRGLCKKNQIVTF
jgi:hypothetical protein